jgi:hypothetical protein
VGTPDSLCEDWGNVDRLQLGACLFLGLVRARVGHDQTIQFAGVDPFDRRSREDSMRDCCVDLLRAGFIQLLHRHAERAACIGHVVHKNRHFTIHLEFARVELVNAQKGTKEQTEGATIRRGGGCRVILMPYCAQDSSSGALHEMDIEREWRRMWQKR